MIPKTGTYWLLASLLIGSLWAGCGGVPISYVGRFRELVMRDGKGELTVRRDTTYIYKWERLIELATDDSVVREAGEERGHWNILGEAIVFAPESADQGNPCRLHGRYLIDGDRLSSTHENEGLWLVFERAK